MIFVTVGTHEQQFNRLIEEVDRLKEKGTIKEEVFIQTGYSTYEPRYCEWSKLIPYKEMQRLNKEARIVITHGGPASFVAPLQLGKIPIVVPRQAKFDEHVNDHQVDFSKAVSERNKNILAIFDIKDLEKTIKNYDKLVKKIDKTTASHNKEFCEAFNKEVKRIFEK